MHDPQGHPVVVSDAPQRRQKEVLRAGEGMGRGKWREDEKAQRVGRRDAGVAAGGGRFCCIS